jgi:hypothetical protein
MNKKVTAIGLTAGLLAGAGAGFLLESSGNAGASANGSAVVAANSTATTTPGDSGTSTDPAADPTGDPTADHAARLQSVLKPLVDDGTLTQAQADKVIAALQAAGPLGGGHMGGDGDGDHGPGGPGIGRGAGFDSVATLLGVTTDELQTALQGGQPLAQIAEAHGKTAQDVVDVLVADITQHFADEVAAGEHTQAEADQMIAAFTQQITDAVNNGGPVMGGPGGPGRPGGRGHHGDGDHGGMGGTDSPTTSTGA